RGAAGVGRCVCVAPGVGFDEGMRERIERHRADRDSSWRTVEEAVEVWDVIGSECQEGRVVVLDCLTLWLNNLMLEDRDVESDLERLVEALESVEGELILVSNEIGLGLVPDTELGREFRDLHGRMNQRVAAVCDRVLFMVAGLPVVVKG
ncbi:MAG: bifunctional adenosylcobinamide kinase/adenosylcobinamide-phosphate guanylyltransferase, partial [Chloroflexi bacterium]|nr:bifunctional adenosylcobinamide kinase/adenosylcobinamide-phosphate guanylyltransferase [Chloroflexota bacterium]